MAFERLGGFLGNLKGLFKGADSPIVSEMSPGPSISKKAPPTQGFGTKSMDFLTKQMDRMEIPIEEFSNHWQVQLNDTHPSIAVAELMRLLVDERHV